MIRIYPSRLPGEPLETHQHGTTTLGAWLSRNVTGYEADIEQPISIDVDGVPVHQHEWYCHEINEDSDVRIYPVPYASGAAIAAWAALAIAAVSLVYALTLNVDTDPGTSQTGDKIDLNPAKANRPRLGEPVREVLGQVRVYPDYVAQPVSRFVNKKVMQTEMFLCVGAGRHSILASSIKIGDTPLAAFGSDASYTIYEPGADVSGDARTENWYVCGEVGGTDAGTAGLDLGSTIAGGTGALANAVVVSGTSIALAGESAEYPETWGAGTIIEFKAPNTYHVSEVGGYNRIAGPLADLAPFVGQKVTLSTNVDEINLTVASVSPYVAPTPGVGGSPSMVSASAAPTTYDFTEEPAVWVVTYRGVSRTISLAADYINMSGLVSEITSQLSGMGLVAQDYSGRLRLIEPSSPYQGGTISQSSAPVELYGVGPIYVVGTASSGGSPGQDAFITLEYDNGVPFIGLPLGQQRLALGYRSNRYRVLSIDGLTMVVSRLTDTGAVDTGWSGFSGRTLLDFSMLSEQTSGANWIGPFMACPENETATVIEYDMIFPSGLTDMSYKGRVSTMSIDVQLQYRDAAIGGAWTTITQRYSEATVHQIGFTHRIDLPYPMRPEVRVRRVQAKYEWNDKIDTVYWYGLRSRLVARPASYPDVTTIALTIRTGDRLGAQSDRRVNMVATRLYDEGATRSISGAALCVLDGLGIDRSEVDVAQIQALESTYWTPRGETFDHAFTDRSAVRDVMKTIFGAGMGHLILSAGLISAIREGVQPPKGMLTPGEMTEELKVGFQMPTADDFSGVDVEYLSSTTWAIETVPCRLPGVEATKVETVRLEGVTDRSRAWRIGMRRLRKHQAQRLTFECATEMDAWVYEYLDHIVLADDIPGTTQSASIVDIRWAGGEAIIDVDEPLDWGVAAPMVMIRRHDGSATGLAEPRQIGDYTLAVPASLIDFDIVTDLSIEPARLLFGDSTRVGYPAMIEEISPSGDGRHSLTAVEYSDDFYADDDNYPPA